MNEEGRVLGQSAMNDAVNRESRVLLVRVI